MYKKNKGFTLLEVLIGSVLFLIIFIGISFLLKEKTDRDNMNDLATRIAYDMHSISYAYKDYIDDNLEVGIKEEILVEDLMIGGYIDTDERPKDPLGLEYSLVIEKNAEDVPLTIALILKGEIDEQRKNNLNIENQSDLDTLYNKALVELKELTIDSKSQVGFLQTDKMIVKWNNADKEMDLTEYLSQEKLENTPLNIPVLFLNMQKNSGYFIFNINSTSVLDPDAANNEILIDSLGYSRFCPSPQINQSSMNYTSFENKYTIELDEDEDLNTVGDGDFTKNFYFCVPESEFGSDEYEKTVHGVSFLDYTNNNYVRRIGECLTHHHKTFGAEISIRGNTYKMIGSIGRRNATCDMVTVYTYQKFLFNKGEFEFDNEYDLSVKLNKSANENKNNYDNNPNFYIRDIPITKIEIDY